MYRTARGAIYDVLDQTFISLTITEYPSTPGTLPPVEYVLSATVPSRGREDWGPWLTDALRGLTAEAEREHRDGGEPRDSPPSIIGGV